MSAFRKTRVGSTCIYCFANSFFQLRTYPEVFVLHGHVCTRTHAHVAKPWAGFWFLKTFPLWTRSMNRSDVDTIPLTQRAAAQNRRCCSARKVGRSTCRNRMNRFWWMFLHLWKENKHHTSALRQPSTTGKCFRWKCEVVSAGLLLLAQNSCYWN